MRTYFLYGSKGSPSKETDQRHLEELRYRHIRRLRELEKAQASLGYSTPPEVNLEAEDIRTKLSDIDTRLLDISSSDVLEIEAIDNITGNHLGYGIFLGGTYNGVGLGLVTSNWSKFKSTWVKSGWLYIEGETPSLAAAFFKIRLRDDGNGYIHIVGVSNPPHTVWLETKITGRMERQFSWNDQPDAMRTDLWRFIWKKNA